jgi:hypothetical protein
VITWKAEHLSGEFPTLRKEFRKKNVVYVLVPIDWFQQGAREMVGVQGFGWVADKREREQSPQIQ